MSKAEICLQGHGDRSVARATVGAAPSRDAESRCRGKASHSAQGPADGEVSADQVQGHGTVRVVADTGLVGGGEFRGMLGREQA